MTELADIYDFEGQLDEAVATALNNFLFQELGLRAYPLQTNEDLPESRIDVSVTVQGATGPNNMTQELGSSANAYMARLEVSVITRRQTFPNAGRARALVRAAFDPRNSVDAQIAESLQFLDIVDITPTECNRGVQDDAEKKQDVSMISYSMRFSIKPDAFPST